MIDEYLLSTICCKNQVSITYLTFPGAVLDFLAAAALFHVIKLLETTAALLHRDSDFG